MLQNDQMMLAVQVDTEEENSANVTQDFLKPNKWDLLQWPGQSTDLSPVVNLTNEWLAWRYQW